MLDRAVAALRECEKGWLWDDPEFREYFEEKLEHLEIEEAWEYLVYNWYADEQTPVWWSSIINVAKWLQNEEKVAYAEMRRRLVLEQEGLTWYSRLGPTVHPYWAQPQEMGTYLVWIENEKCGYWTCATYSPEPRRIEDTSTWRNGLWSTGHSGPGSERSVILYWRDFPDPPHGHKKWESEGLYE